jgi:3-phenylpropionate/trans-cinnamate dioxygenase ferredoxin reductase component
MTDPIVIVGAGECGARAALALRERGYAGRVVLIGDERNGPYERPPLSKATLTAPADVPSVAVEAPSMQVLLDAGVECLLNAHVIAIDRSVGALVVDGGDTIAYSQLILATGARARQLSIPGGKHALTLRTFDDAVALRTELMRGKRVCVVGAGFIGLEAAASARALGCEVTVLEMAPRVLGRAVPSDLAATLAKRHEAEGVLLRCGVEVERVDRVGDGFVVVLADGERIECDVVLAGIGSQPNVELAEAAGLTIANGIAVDARLCTSDPLIFAAGDCCSFPHPLDGDHRMRLESWRNAIDQGRHAAGSVLGDNEPYRAVPWFWSDQYDLMLQIAGMSHAATEHVERRRPDGGVVLFGFDDHDRIVSAAGLGVGAGVAKDVRIAEMLIAAQATPDRAVLADASSNLRLLLKGLA